MSLLRKYRYLDEVAYAYAVMGYNVNPGVLLRYADSYAGIHEVEPQSTTTLRERKDWYLEMISAELEALPEGPHKEDAKVALRQMVARMIILEDALKEAKEAKKQALRDASKEGQVKNEEKEKLEKEKLDKEKLDKEKETMKVDTPTGAPSLLSSQLAPQP